MKVRNLFYAVMAFVLASCAAKPGDVTKITGQIADTNINAVQIRFPSHQIDTVLNLEEGRFEIDIISDVKDHAMVMMLAGETPKAGSYFISDGTELNVSFDGENVKVTSSMYHLQSKYAAYYDDLSAIYKAESQTMATELETLWMETVKANPDNAIATLVVSDAMYELTPEKMLELVALIQEPVRSGRFVANREKEAKAQLNTKPGMKFTDFEVEHVYGYDRSADPQPLKKTVKFSDYVGKGTYVLVDFWSPWCGPCRREIPNIAKVYEEYKAKNLEVLSIAVWERKPQSHTIEVAGQLGMDWLHINNAKSVPTEIYGIGGIPHLMLIGPDGTILERGFHGLEGIQNAVAKHIK